PPPRAARPPGGQHGPRRRRRRPGARLRPNPGRLNSSARFRIPSRPGVSDPPPRALTIIQARGKGRPGRAARGRCMDAQGEGRRRRGAGERSVAPASRLVAVAAAALLAGAGCRGAGEATDRMVPRWWRGNPWGPAANAARLRGEIPTVPNNPDMVTWEDWGRRHLHDGDILFRMGDARAACGLFPFSRVSAAIAGSRFSHTGIVAFEDGLPVVYDTTPTGPQRQPFPIWLLDPRGSFAVKRPCAAFQHLAPEAAAFCRAVYHAQVPFDFDMRLGDERFYCIELTERAYRHAGLPLS